MRYGGLSIEEVRSITCETVMTTTSETQRAVRSAMACTLDGVDLEGTTG
jgi:hypothetical protein